MTLIKCIKNNDKRLYENSSLEKMANNPGHLNDAHKIFFKSSTHLRFCQLKTADKRPRVQTPEKYKLLSSVETEMINEIGFISFLIEF